MNHPMKSGQHFVDQTPSYGRKRKKSGFGPNQVLGKSGIIRKDRRLKAKFL